MSDLEVKQVQDWFQRNVRTADGEPFLLDIEQAAAVLSENKSLLVQARAGSGKTRVLIARFIYVAKVLNVPENEIVLLAFNKSVREEIISKLEVIYAANKWPLGINLKDSVHTFHSFASGITKDGKNLLRGRDRTEFIQRIIENECNTRIFSRKIVQFLKTNSDLENADYDEAYPTIRGEFVASGAEQDIANFLFEHGVDYQYETSYLPADFTKHAYDYSDRSKLQSFENGIKNDFYLPEYGMVLEHWAITGQESKKEIESFVEETGIDYKKYAESKKFKEWFYPWLIENDLDDQDYRYGGAVKQFYGIRKDKGESSEAFESRLKGLLELKLEKELNKLPVDQLIGETWEESLSRLTKNIESFIDRAQLKYFDNPSALDEDMAKSDGGLRVKLFLYIARRVFSQYVEYLHLQQPDKPSWLSKRTKNGQYGDAFTEDTDFHHLLLDGLNSLRDGKYSRKISQLLIDEFQDTNDMFFAIIKEIDRLNSDLKILAVGDDWQAINRFMGASTSYFNTFEEHFQDSATLPITTNYRSSQSIVNNGNDIMASLLDDTSNPARASQNCPPSYPIFQRDIMDDIQITYDKKIPRITSSGSGSGLALRYAKILRDIIINNRGSEIMILHRNNNFSKLEGTSVKPAVQAIKDRLETDKDFPFTKDQLSKIKVSTVHMSKGMEADVVILLETDDSVMEFIHPDSKLFTIFGESEDKILDDAARLYYVASTRAREQLYILHGGDTDLHGGDTDNNPLSSNPKLSHFVDIVSKNSTKFYLNDEPDMSEVVNLTVSLIGCQWDDKVLKLIARDPSTGRCYVDKYHYTRAEAIKYTTFRALKNLRRLKGFGFIEIDTTEDARNATEFFIKSINDLAFNRARVVISQRFNAKNYLDIDYLGLSSNI